MIEVTNMAEFNRTFNEYIRLNKRDLKDIVHAKSLQCCFAALRQTPKAAQVDIKTLPEKDWWVKYISKMISSGASYTTTRKGKKTRHNKKSELAKGRYQQLARKISRQIIGVRMRSIAYIKSGWLPAIHKLSGVVKKERKESTDGVKLFGRVQGGADLARDSDQPSCEIYNQTRGVDKVGLTALVAAFDEVRLDMQEYINRKMQERINGHWKG